MATLTKASGIASFSSNIFSSMSASVTQIGTRRDHRDVNRALRSLAHAIEYLSDEYVDGDNSMRDQKSMLDAIHLLMDLQQRLYDGSIRDSDVMHEQPLWSRILAG